MLRVSQIMQVSVLQPKRATGDDPVKAPLSDLTLVGQVRQVVFSPKGDRVVGFLVRRPDVAGMIRREDAFVALDSFAVRDEGLVVTRAKDGMDDAARQRLELDWNTCLMWTGMDAKTTDGKQLGWVSDVSFYPKSGKVHAFHVGDGAVAKSLVGNVVIPAEMLVGYRDGCLVVAPEAAKLALDGGLAAKAGESYARAKYEGKKAASKAGKTAGDMAQKGARGLGKALGKARGRTKGMFGSFVEEYKKASK